MVSRQDVIGAYRKDLRGWLRERMMYVCDVGQGKRDEDELESLYIYIM